MKNIYFYNKRSVLVDDEDYEWLSEYRWSMYRVRKTDLCYARREKPSGKGYINMHREIFEKHNGCCSSMLDHADGNGLNNTKDNLRVCNGSQNAHNRKRIHGVSMSVSGLRFRARIMISGRAVDLGHYDKEIEAHKAFIRASIVNYGEFSPYYSPATINEKYEMA